MLQDCDAVLRSEHVVVAEVGPRIAGVLVLSQTPEGFLIDNVAVFPEWKGQGIGRLLLAHAETAAGQAGYGSLYLFTNDKMVENIALYAGLGYAEYKRERGEGFCRVFMRKALPANDTRAGLP